MKTQNKTYITVEIEVNVRSAANSYDTGDKLAKSTVKYEATLPVVEAAESVVRTLCTEAMKQVVDELQKAAEDKDEDEDALARSPAKTSMPGPKPDPLLG